MQLNTFTETFNVRSDIDPQALKSRALAEAKEIFSKESTRRDRTLQEITAACMFGHASEIHMIESGGYKDDTRKYKDLYTPTGDKQAEVKTVGYPAAVKLEIERCNDRKQEAWRNFPDYVFMWIGNRKTGDYYFEGLYVWNKNEKKFKKNVSD